MRSLLLASGFAAAWFAPAAILAAVCLAGFLPTAFGADFTWTGAGANDNWTTPDNWGGTAPSPGSSTFLFFDGTDHLNPINDFSPDSSFPQITFESTAGPFTLDGNSITLAWSGTATAITNHSANLQTINLDLILPATANRTFAGSGDILVGGDMTVSGTITNTGAGALTLSGDVIKAGVARFHSDGGAFTVSGNVRGTNNSVFLSGGGDGVLSGDITTGWNVVKQDSGTWTLEGTIGPLDGPLGVSVEGGALRVTRSDALGSTGVGARVSTGARLELSGGITVTGEAIRIGGDGGSGYSGALRSLDGHNVWEGPVILDGPGGTTGTRVGAVNAGSILEISGPIQDGTRDSVTIRNEQGKTIFSGQNTYTGGTRIFSGTLELGAHDSLPAGTWLPLGTGALNATFDLAGFNQTIGTLESVGTGNHVVTNTGNAASTLTITQNSNQTFSGQITNGDHALNLVKAGGSRLTLSGNNTYTGTTLVSTGTLALSHASNNNIAASPLVRVDLGATLRVTGLADETFHVADGQTLGGKGTIDGNVHVAGAGAVLAPGMSVGTLNLDGDLTFSQDAFFDIDIGDVGLADMVQMDGGLLSPGDATIRVNLGFRPELGASWTILQGEGDIAGLFNPDVTVLSGAGFLDGGKRFEVGYGNSVYLTVVPEPGTWLLLLSALACGLLVRRRR